MSLSKTLYPLLSTGSIHEDKNILTLADCFKHKPSTQIRYFINEKSYSFEIWYEMTNGYLFNF